MIYRNDDAIREEIKAIMKSKGILQSDMAEYFGMSPQGFYAMFNKSRLRFETVEKICSAMGYKMCITLVPEDVHVDEQKLRILEAINKLFILADKPY